MNKVTSAIIGVGRGTPSPSLKGKETLPEDPI